MFHQAKILGQAKILILGLAFAAAPYKPLSPDAFKKRVQENQCVFVNLWATWCEPCVQELPGLVAYLKQNKKVHPVIIDVSFPEERATKSAKILHSMETPFETFYKPDGNEEKFITAIDPQWQGSLPYSMLFVNGQPKKTWNGAMTANELQQAVKANCPNADGSTTSKGEK